MATETGPSKWWLEYLHESDQEDDLLESNKVAFLGHIDTL